MRILEISNLICSYLLQIVVFASVEHGALLKQFHRLFLMFGIDNHGAYMSRCEKRVGDNLDVLVN